MQAHAIEFKERPLPEEERIEVRRNAGRSQQDKQQDSENYKHGSCVSCR
jgi:hypothetical protein